MCLGLFFLFAVVSKEVSGIFFFSNIESKYSGIVTTLNDSDTKGSFTIFTSFSSIFYLLFFFFKWLLGFKIFPFLVLYVLGFFF